MSVVVDLSLMVDFFIAVVRGCKHKFAESHSNLCLVLLLAFYCFACYSQQFQ